MVVVDVGQAGADAQLAGVHAATRGRCPATSRSASSSGLTLVPEVVVAQEVDHRQRAEPEVRSAAASGLSP